MSSLLAGVPTEERDAVLQSWCITMVRQCIMTPKTRRVIIKWLSTTTERNHGQAWLAKVGKLWKGANEV